MQIQGASGSLVSGWKFCFRGIGTLDSKESSAVFLPILVQNPGWFLASLVEGFCNRMNKYL